MNWILGAVKLPLSTLLGLGALGASIIIAWSYANWRTAVKVAFVAVLVEGAIRKWLLPSGEELVYFLKDVFLIGAYVKFYFAPDPELRALRLRVPGTIIFLLCALVSFSALNPNIGSPLLAAYGLKIYFMYVPLTFMMPYLFRTQQEMLRQLTWYVLLAIPICLLGFLQYSSDRFSVINTFASGMSETGATGFGVGDRARVTGTFSYLTGHTTFVIVFFALTVALLALRETRWKWLLIFVLIPMLAGNALMGGSRATVVSMSFVTVGFTLVSMSGRLGTSRNFVMILAFGSVLAIGGAVYFFTDALAHWESRAHTAGDSMHSRTIDHPLAALKAAMEEGGVFGFGIGTEHPATVAIRNKLGILPPKARPPFLDNELGEVLAELGIMGFLSWYALRLVLLWLTWQSYRSSPAGIVRVLCLAVILIAGPFLLMSVVYNHTASFFVFALSGFGLIPLLEPTIQRRVVPRPGAAPRVALPGSTSAPAIPRHRGRRM
ncbi:MAG: hypothetical protein B7Z37_28775 [Verrucomicrobia bacterium 12-59-8]|nr:MAG: hypothetical protein B7Z37_28775 [Verrucomicrobia bacterium 12-59-8]